MQSRTELAAELEEAKRELETAREELRELRGKSFDPSRIIWIFGTGRSGTTWLASMLAEFGTIWNEPLVGKLFGEFYYGSQKRGRMFIMGEPYRKVWLGSIRNFVLEGAATRYPERSGYLVVKEPHGTMGAPLLSEAMPESRLIFIVRDPRDVISSALDGQKQDSWTAKLPRWRDTSKPKTLADTNPNRFVRARAKTYFRDITKAREAFDSHEGPKALIRYEDMRADTLDTMRRVCSVLGIEAGEELERVVEKHAWENVPEEEKGEGKFYRKATPGSWREDLTPQQARIAQEITRPVLEEFYPAE